MDNITTLIKYTLQDLLRQKSIYLLLGLSILFVLMLRGCYDGQYVVNGRVVDHGAIAWYAARIVFQVISAGVFFLAVLVAMKTFSRDRSDGTLVMIMSRPVSRWQYVIGRITGTWIFCLMILFVLHATVFVTVWQKNGGAGPPLPGGLTDVFAQPHVCDHLCLLADALPARLYQCTLNLGHLMRRARLRRGPSSVP